MKETLLGFLVFATFVAGMLGGILGGFLLMAIACNWLNGIPSACCGFGGLFLFLFSLIVGGTVIETAPGKISK